MSCPELIVTAYSYYRPNGGVLLNFQAAQTPYHYSLKCACNCNVGYVIYDLLT